MDYVIYKATENIVWIKSYASITAKELGLINNSDTDTYNKIKNLSANNIIDENIRDLKNKLGLAKFDIENHCLPYMYWMPKMHKNPIKDRFIIASPKSSIKPLARTITSIFGLFFQANTNI